MRSRDANPGPRAWKLAAALTAASGFAFAGAWSYLEATEKVCDFDCPGWDLTPRLVLWAVLGLLSVGCALFFLGTLIAATFHRRRPGPDGDYE